MNWNLIIGLNFNYIFIGIPLGGTSAAVSEKVKE